MSAFNLDLKWVALIALVFQNSGLAIAMRYTFVVSSGDRYLPSTAVLIAEILKLSISFIACFVLDANMSVQKFTSLLHFDLVVQKGDWFKLCVPSMLYTLQNSLQYYSMSCLSAPVFQVLYQMKIITTAIFSVLMLAKRLSGLQWSSIVALTLGVALVQLSQTSGAGDGKSNSIMGLLSVVLGCCTSGFAGVYFEMVLKSSNVSIWMRNIQLSIIGIFVATVRIFCYFFTIVRLFYHFLAYVRVLALCAHSAHLFPYKLPFQISCYMRDLEPIRAKGFLTGYNEFVWMVILLQAAGGLVSLVKFKSICLPAQHCFLVFVSRVVYLVRCAPFYGNLYSLLISCFFTY